MARVIWMAGLLLWCLSVVPARAASVFDPAAVGAPGSDAPAELFRPEGTGPFPAIVVLHGCDGVGPHYRAWARRLAGWGYVALLVDSFRPRGLATVCNQRKLVPAEDRADDAYAAAAWLRGRGFVRADRVGVLGFSHGGWAVLKAVLADRAAGQPAPPFAAAVAYYPGCQKPTAPLVTDTLILIGEADDWTPARFCSAWRHKVVRAGHVVEFHPYPGALHGFDSARLPHVFAGHQVGRNEAAAPLAEAAVREFLAARLGRP